MKSQPLTVTLPSVVGGIILIHLNKVPSLNQFYSSKHWAIRKKHKDTIAAQVLEQLEKHDLVTYKGVEVYLQCNYRMDLDNCIMAVKFVMDSFKKWGGIQDDSPKYFKKLRMEVNQEMPKDSCVIELREIL